MHFTPELAALQGVIISANHVHSFSKITSRGGNEEKILDIVGSLFNFLQEKQFLTEEGVTEKAKSEMRKFCFYLLLNADFPVLEEMVEMPDIDTIIWTLPTITKCLICEMVWGLSMEIYLYEVIAFCNPQLAFQVLTAFTDSISHSTPMYFSKKAKVLCMATYRLICRLHFFNYENSFTTKLLFDVYECFLRSINYYITPPKADQLNRLSDYNSYKYKGDNLYSLLSLTLDCLEHFTTSENFESEGFEDMYLSTIKPECIKTRLCPFEMCNSQEASILEYLQKCNTSILDTVATLLMEVSVSIFCTWSEIQQQGKTMQQSIGELCFKLNSKLEHISSLSEHAVTKVLPQLSCKPVDICDIIKSADNDTIIENANKNTEHKTLWIGAILQNKSLCQNVAFQECLISNVDYLKVEDRNKLIDEMLSFLKDNKPEETFKVLFFKIISDCDHTKRDEIIAQHFSNKYFNNSLETSNFNAYITEIFNKFISTSDVNLSEMYHAFIQNPSKFFTKVLNSAIGNIKQSELMIKIMEVLEKFSEHYYENDTNPCIVKAIDSISSDQLQTDCEQGSFIKFIVGIKKKNILPGPKLLLLLIMPKLHQALIDKDFNLIYIQVKLMRECYSSEEFVEYRTPLLAMLGQVLETVRWTILTYEWTRTTTLSEAIALQKDTLDTYHGDIPERDANWLKIKLKDLMPMNMYYFKELWHPPGDTYLEMISGQRNIDKQNLIHLISKLMCSATAQEWSLIWDSLRSYQDLEAMDIVYESVIVNTNAEPRHRTDCTWACMLNIYRNFIIIIKEKYLGQAMSHSHVEDVIDKAIDLVNVHSEEDMKDIEPILLSLFSYIAENQHGFVLDVSDFRFRITHSNFAVMINQIFANGDA